MAGTSQLIEDITKLAGSAVDTAVHSFADMKKYVEDTIHKRIESFLESRQWVSREEYEVLREMVQQSRIEQELLKTRLEQLEKRAS